MRSFALLSLVLGAACSEPISRREVARCVDEFGFGVEGSESEAELERALGECEAAAAECPEQVISVPAALCIAEASGVWPTGGWEGHVLWGPDLVVWELTGTEPVGLSMGVRFWSLRLDACDGAVLELQSTKVQ